MQEISFWVPGIPKPAGSKRGFVNRKTGGVIITDACKLTKSWQADVKVFAYEAMHRGRQGPGRPLMTDPLELVVTFKLSRPKHHYRTGKNVNLLRPDAPPFPASAPDATKLVRAVEDAMTGVVWKDDALVVDQLVSKRYGDPGALITVRVKDIEQELMTAGQKYPDEAELPF